MQPKATDEKWQPHAQESLGRCEWDVALRIRARSLRGKNLKPTPYTADLELRLHRVIQALEKLRSAHSTKLFNDLLETGIYFLGLVAIQQEARNKQSKTNMPLNSLVWVLRPVAANR